jgi:hypothetical protein
MGRPALTQEQYDRIKNAYTEENGILMIRIPFSFTNNIVELLSNILF